MMYKSTHNTGASVILGYSIMLGIGVVMVGLLLSAFGSQLEAQETSAVEAELEIAAGQIVTEFEKADATIRNSNTTTNLVVRPNFTDRAGDPTFQVSLDTTPQPNLYLLRIETQDITIEKPFRSQTPVDTTTSADSARLRIQYDESDDHFQLINRGTEQIASTTTSIETSGDYTIPSNSEEEPSVKTTGSILGGQNSTVHGYLESGDNINTDSSIEIYEYVRADTYIDMENDSYVQEDIEATGDIVLGDNASIGGSVISNSGTVTIGPQSSISNSVSASGDVNIGQNSRISNEITSNGTVNLDDDVRVVGEINVNSASDIVCGDNVTIFGVSCSEYKNNY